MTKRIFALMCALIMLLSMMSVVAFATDDEEEDCLCEKPEKQIPQ